MFYYSDIDYIAPHN